MAKNAMPPAGGVTHGRVIRIAFPIFVSNATVPILGAVDTAAVGQLGAAEPIGAVGIGAVILSAIYWLFGFLRTGTVGLTAQARGEGDEAEVLALFTRALLLGGAAGLGLIVLQWPIFSGAFQISPASPRVETLARDYLSTRVWSAPALIAMYGITGWLVAQERTGAVLAIQVVMNGVNMLLDLWFVLGLDLGVSGVAWATFIAEWGGLVLSLWICRTVFRTTGWRDRARVFDRDRLWRMAVVNRDIMLRSAMLQVVFVSFLFLGGPFGDVTLAANQILLQFVYITSYALDGFAYGAQALVGQAVGRRDSAMLHRSVLLTCLWALGMGVVTTLCFGLFGGWMIGVMTTARDVQDVAGALLPFAVLMPLSGLAAWMLDGIFVGATRARDMRNMMALSVLIYGLAVLALVPSFGNTGLWLALHVSMIARGVTLAWRYPALLRDVRAGEAGFA